MNCKGMLIPALNSVFSLINMNAVTEGEFTPRIPDVDLQIVNQIAEKVLKELYEYRLMNGKLKAYVGTLINLENTEETIDPNELINITWIDHIYYFDLLKEFGRLEPTVYKFPVNTAIPVDYNSLGIVGLHDLLKDNEVELNSALEDMLVQMEDIDTIVEKAISILTMPTYQEIYNKIINLDVKDVYVLTIIQILLTNLFDIAVTEGDSNTKESIGGLLTTVNEKLRTIINLIDRLIENNVVIREADRLGKTEYEIVAIETPWRELRQEHPEVSLKTLMGAGLTILANNPNDNKVIKFLTEDDILINKEEYENTLDRFKDMLVLKAKQNIRTRVGNKLVLASDIISKDAKDKNILIDIVNEFTESTDLDTLADIRKTAKEVFEAYSLAKGYAGYLEFLRGIENTIALTGNKDISENEALFLGSIDVLGSWLNQQLKAV
jgi:hypothetical protein